MSDAETASPPSEEAAQEAQDLCARALRQARLCDVPGYQEAVALLVEARELTPDSGEIEAALAETFVHWGWRREIVGLASAAHYEDAYACAARAVELAPGSGDSHRALAAASRYGRRRDPARALSEAERAWEINPYNSDNCLELWRARGRDADDPLLEHAVALDPDSCAAHIDAGVALTEAGRHPEAAYHLERALELNPANALARYDHAMILSRADRPEQAREELAAALRANPAEPLLRRGWENILWTTAGSAR